MPFLERAAARIYYETYPANYSDAGAGWVTLINGHARTSSDFRAFAKFLSEKGKSVLTLDNRGSGRTTSPPFSFDDMLDDVVALWDSLHIARSHVLGISYGGVISQNLAALHPSRVQSLVLASTTAESRHLDEGRRLADLSMDQRQKELARYFGSQFAKQNAILFQSLVKQMAKSFDDPGLAQNARSQKAALNQFDFRERLSQIQCPCLILHGTDDRVIGVESARELHKYIASSTLELFDGVGHLFLAETPRRFYDTALAFFEANDS
jgi:3-oxoadipate enol-lactonase